ncbi:ABC transport protein, ATP-binding protein [Candidatus Protofrankia californiensis]|uniref:ABC transport protein, ATP-binding protein n=1 Tax=Candidatus Protofrankia californiensis TaxID=1839754 RepID=A0A1C3NTI0_9ACTN|nr:ABC transport protein, ATP-binding protein [Candidatus Protofrankia californiensis]
MRSEGAILAARNVSKRFGGLYAVCDVSLDVRPGEVVCLLGDNGAGKSTLIKMLTGVTTPTSGELVVDGKPTVFSSPREARDAGIAAVQQFGGTVPLMSVSRNFFLGAELTRGWGPFKRMDLDQAGRIAVQHLAEMGLTRLTDANRLVGSLSGGERQALAIARAMYFGARVLILDEPTAALGVKEATTVLRLVKRTAERGIGVVLVTHNATHAIHVGDRFVVLIHGAVAADFRRGERSRNELINLMAGGEELEHLEAALL